MKILVTGGAGFIGSHTCVALIEAGYEPVVIDNLCNASEKSLARVAELTRTAVPFYRGDVRDEALLARIFAEHDIPCVIHFAGLKAVGESVQKPLEYYENNLMATTTLCRVMAKAGVKRIIFSSSATVYSGGNEMPLTETSRTGRSTSVSRSCATWRGPTANGRSSICATSTPSAHIRAACSARTRAAFRTTSCPTSHRLPSGGATT